MTQHKRDVLSMQNANREKSKLAAARVQAVINEMLKNNQTITFNNIANQAQVSKGWLYRENAICKQIMELRLQNKDAERPVLQSSLIAKDAIISTLKNRLKKLELENKELRKQIEVVYGELHNRK